MAKTRQCPRCGSREIVRLPENGIAPHPGYQCKGCGTAMRPNGTVIVWLAVLLISSIMAGFLFWQWFDPQFSRAFVVLPIAAAAVALYSVYQLTRPAPKIVEDDPIA